MKDLIILRGLPGVGKSNRARELLDEYRRTRVQGEIYSTDYYNEIFGWDTRYFNRNHMWNRRDGSSLMNIEVHGKIYSTDRYHKMLVWDRDDVFRAMKRGVTPIIVDNTNVYCWHMYPYVFMGMHRRYYITVEEVPRGYPENFIPLNTLYRWCKGNIPKRKLRKFRDDWKEVDSYQDVLGDEYSIKKWKHSNEEWNVY